MKKALWYLFAATRGGENRVRLVQAIRSHPKNANQLSNTLDLGYNTVRYHLDLLIEHNVIEEGNQEYGRLYFLTEQFEQHLEEFDSIIENMEDSTWQ